MVLLTAAIGCFLATENGFDWILALHTVLGTGLLAAGTAVLNQVIEKKADSRMRRTAKRPLPTGKIQPFEALLFGIVLIVSGTAYLYFAANFLTALLGWLTSVIYLAIYTPLKKHTAFCTVIGAIPGAAPPLMGWTAVRGELSLDSLLLFLLLFSWQFPHFLAIAMMYQDDYRRGGFHMLPANDITGKKTAVRILFSTFILVIISFLLTWTDLMGVVYMTGAAILGAGLIWISFQLASFPSKAAARNVLKASVIYLPLMLALMVFDRF